jgi:NADH:ubiquinone oxidoreductase subunit 3 (subunit A)
MPSGWEVYYVVFLSALLALGIPLSLSALTRLVAPGRRRARPPTAPREGGELGRRMNSRFFLATNAALVLIALALVLVPAASTLQAGNTRAGLVRGLVAIVSIAGLAALGLLYSARKGDLSWLRTYREERE